MMAMYHRGVPVELIFTGVRLTLPDDGVDCFVILALGMAASLH